MVLYYLILFGTVALIAYSYRSVHIVTHKMLPRYKWLFRIIFLLIVILVYASTSYFAHKGPSRKCFALLMLAFDPKYSETGQQHQIGQ